MTEIVNFNAQPTLYGVTYGSVGGRNVEHEFVIQQFEGDEDQTAWQKMREKMIETFEGYQTGYRFELGLGWIAQNKGKTAVQIGVSVIGDKEWLEGVEWFKSYIGDMGGSAPLEASGFGIIDKTRGLRIEFDGNMFVIRPLKQ